MEAPPTQFARSWLAVSLLVASVICFWTTLWMGISSFAYFLLVGGLFLRKSKLTHMRFMTSAMVLDLVVVLILEFGRSALATALAMSLTPAQQAHIVTSTLALVLYFPIFTIGLKLFKNPGPNHAERRRRHLTLGILAFILRTAGFILMFSMLSHIQSTVD